MDSFFLNSLAILEGEDEVILEVGLGLGDEDEVIDEDGGVRVDEGGDVEDGHGDLHP